MSEVGMRVNVSRLVESYSIFLKRAGDKTGLEIAINTVAFAT